MAFIATNKRCQMRQVWPYASIRPPLGIRGYTCKFTVAFVIQCDLVRKVHLSEAMFNVRRMASTRPTSIAFSDSGSQYQSPASKRDVIPRTARYLPGKLVT